MKVAYPTSEYDLIDFLRRCKISNSKTMICPRCSAVFDKEAASNIVGFRPQSKRKGKWVDRKPKFDFNRRDLTYKASTQKTFSKKSRMRTFTPPSGSPAEKWVFSVKKVTSTNTQKETSDLKKFSYSNNYKGRNPMTKTHWRRFQRQKKDDVLKDINNTEKGKEKQVAAFEVTRNPATERIFPPLYVVKENFTKEDDEMTSNFNNSEADFDVICVVSILPVEYDVT